MIYYFYFYYWSLHISLKALTCVEMLRQFYFSKHNFQQKFWNPSYDFLSDDREILHKLDLTSSSSKGQNTVEKKISFKGIDS